MSFSAMILTFRYGIVDRYGNFDESDTHHPALP